MSTKWSIARARSKFSELIRAAARKPQAIVDDGRVVAAVVGPDALRDLEIHRSTATGKTLAEAFEELRQICRDEAYVLALAQRVDRADSLAGTLDELPG